MTWPSKVGDRKLLWLEDWQESPNVSLSRMRTFSLHFHYQFFTFEGRSVISACFSIPYWQKGLFVTGGGWAAHSASSRASGFVSSPPLTSQMEILDLVGFSLMPANRNTHTHTFSMISLPILLLVMNTLIYMNVFEMTEHVFSCLQRKL